MPGTPSPEGRLHHVLGSVSQNPLLSQDFGSRVCNLLALVCGILLLYWKGHVWLKTAQTVPGIYVRSAPSSPSRDSFPRSCQLFVCPTHSFSVRACSTCVCCRGDRGGYPFQDTHKCQHALCSVLHLASHRCPFLPPRTPGSWAGGTPGDRGQDASVWLCPHSPAACADGPSGCVQTVQILLPGAS